MFEIEIGTLKAKVENIEEVEDIIFKQTNMELLARRIVEICKLMRKGDTFSKKDKNIVISKIE